MSYAPIVLFTYSRADHTCDVVESLLKNKEAAESDLYIFSDGPKTEAKREAVEENRKYIHSITGFKSIHIVEREKNWGLANSLIAGITDVINRYGRVIVVEDDLILSSYFLQYMNEALEKYEGEDKIGAISAYHPIQDVDLPETFFLRYFHCWGWATWKRAWELFNPDARDLLRRIRWKTKKFNIDGGRNNYGMLYCQKVGLVDSWYIRLYASLFLAEKLTLYPKQSLASNHGLDGTGTHSKDASKDNKNIDAKITVFDKPIKLSDIPVEECSFAYQTLHETFVRSLPYAPLWKKKYYQFKSFLRRLLLIDSM